MALTEPDMLDMQALMARFVYALDAGDPKAWTETFAPDGTYRDASQRLTGRDVILPFITDVMTGGHAGPNPTSTPRLVHLTTPRGSKATATTPRATPTGRR